MRLWIRCRTAVAAVTPTRTVGSASPTRLGRGGEAKIGERTVSHEARPAAGIWGVGDYNNEAVISRLAGELALAFGAAAVEPDPLVVEEMASDVLGMVWQQTPPDGDADGPLIALAAAPF
jgi:hypothetical protein